MIRARAELLHDFDPVIALPACARPTTIQIVHAPLASVRIDGFRVYGRDQIALDEVRVEMCVIGESSLVSVHTPRGEWVEIIAGGLEAGPGSRAEVPLSANAAAAVGAATPGCRYQARLFTAALGEAPFGAPLPHSLSHRFGGEGGPLTVIEADLTSSALRLSTRHDYPEVGVAVWSESLWRLS